MTTRLGQPPFASAEEYFEAARRLMTQLEHKAHDEAAAELREGFACLNGLTDGWAMFLESIEKVHAAGHGLDPDDRRTLEALLKAARATVRRR